MICSKCNFQNVNGSQFCGNCGAKLKLHKSSGKKNRAKLYFILSYVVIATALLLWFSQNLLTPVADLFDISLQPTAIIVTALSGACILASLISKYRVTLLWILCPAILSSSFSIWYYQLESITFEYKPQAIEVPQGTTLQEAGYQAFPDLKKKEEKYGIGGTKLICEMSADADGKPFSSFDFDENVSLKDIMDLNLRYSNNTQNIIQHIFNGNITVNVTNVQSGGWLSPVFTIYIDIINIKDKPITVTVEQGQMIEVGANDVQNIVVSQEQSVLIASKGKKSISLKAFCAAENRGNPSGKPARITPFILNAPPSAFSSQEEVWNFINRSRRNADDYTITFYAWGEGDRTPSGVSKYGHAFVNIPNIGTFGFSTIDGIKLYGESKVYDHTKDIPYATHKHVAKISKEGLRSAKAKFREWRDNPPHYTIGRYDCTTFVMDIADAAGIKYGNRWTIQTPAGFMEELKRYNE
jgi:hypothetical protein